jgi:hypothetical protein
VSALSRPVCAQFSAHSGECSDSFHCLLLDDHGSFVIFRSVQSDLYISAIVTSTMITSSNSLVIEGVGCPINWTAFYFTPCPSSSCPTYEPNSIDGEY